MRKYTLFTTVIFILIAQNAMAHGGHKKEQTSVVVAEEPSSIDPIYATQEEEPDP